jgi:maltose-binding protein MalE
MKKIILASVSSIALLGLVACGDTDNTTTQSIEPEVQETAPTVVPDNETNVTVVPEADTAIEPTDDTTTQSIETEEEPGVTIVQPEGGATGAAPMAAPDGSADVEEIEPADDVPAVQ